MASDHNLLTTTTTFRMAPNRRKFHIGRRKVPYVRLGGGKKQKTTTTRGGGRGRLLLVKMLKKLRIRWVKLQYMCMLKKLKQYYCTMIKELIEAGTNIESFQQRVMLESSFALPVMGISFSNYPSATRC